MTKAVPRFFRLTIARKLLLGFVSYGILTILIAVIALSSLQRLNEINHRIINRDIPLVDIGDKMIEALLAQELYGRRSVILKSSEMEELFWRRSEEFKNFLREMGRLPEASGLPLDRLTALHEEYNDLFKSRLERKGSLSSEAFQDHGQQVRQKLEEIIQRVKEISRDARADQNEKSLETLSLGYSAFWLTAGLSFGGLILAILIALIITHNISRSINQLKLSTWEISGGKFDHLPEVRNQDELGDLSLAVQKMAQRLKRLEEMSLDANPLTHLPGSIAIENVLNQRLKEETPLAFCQLDLSHFKAFNDRYGYARGNEVIQATAKIVTEAVKGQGNEACFVAHIGGDDFVAITSVESYEKICLAIIDAFDRMVPDFYDLEDRQNGYIQGETRQGQKVSFPIMTLAIAVVTNQYYQLKSHIQIGEIAAELKNYAKSFSRSMLVVNRRKDSTSGQTN